MKTCGSCFGAGKVTCSACGGRGHVSRFGAGGVETTSCAVCYGSGRMRCDFCGGRGQIFSPETPTTTRRQSSPEERQRLRAERQKLRDALQNMYDGSGHSPVFPTIMVALIKGFEEGRNCNLGDLGLPTKKVNRLSQALHKDQATLQAAYEDLMGWLRQAGWIKD